MYTEHFSKHLSKFRKDSELSLTQIGDIIGVSNQYVSLLEKGKRSPSLGVLVAFADYLGVSIDYLVGRTDNPNSHKI
jgi:transcriptional regulator with XRE-family HTH domain